MLNFEQFEQYVNDHVQEFLAPELENAKVNLQIVEKNNGKQLHAIVIREEGSAIAPTIYLEGYFKEYQEGRSLEEVMGNIAKLASNNRGNDYLNVIEQFRDFDNIKDQVVMSVVNAQKNEKFLENVPHTMKEDLAIIYKVRVGRYEHGVATVTLKQDLMDRWGISLEELHNCAMENSKRLLPVTVKSLGDVIMEMMINDGAPEEIVESLKEDMMGPSAQMFVITNRESLNGAASIMYSDALKNLSETLGTDLFVLPSSIHEVLAISTDVADAETFADMVKAVNDEQVAMEEQLSDHVYRYDAKNDTLKLADVTIEEIKRQAETDKHADEEVSSHRRSR